MIHILLTILKITGIVLALLLLVFFLVLTAVLFVPLRYRIYIERDSGEEFSCLVSWFARAVVFCGNYKEKRPTVYLRILWKKKWLHGEDERDKKPPKEKKPPKGKKPPTESRKERRGEDTESEAEDGTGSRDPRPESGKSVQKDDGASERKSGAGRRRLPGPAIRRFLDRFSDLEHTVQRAWTRFCAYVEFVRLETTGEALGILKGHLFYLLSHIRPRRIEGSLHYGTGDPALTGQITGILYLLVPMTGREVELSPDFEEKVLEGELHVKGHVRLCHIAKIAIQVFFSKKLKSCWRQMRELRRK